MKTCPFCAEEIQDAAIVCKHCQRSLSEEVAPAAPVKASGGQRLGKLVVYGILGAGALMLLVALTTNTESEPAAQAKTLAVEIRASATELQITNQGSPAGIPITIYINGTPPFTYRTDATMPPNGETVLRIPLLQFVKKDGERFNPLSHAVTTVWIGGDGYDYRSFTLGR